MQFDTTQNHFLAVGEDSQIKFWDMDNINVLATTDADGGLPSLPRLRFIKEGNLLAVTTVGNGIKILANATGMRSLRTVEAPTFEALRSPLEAASIKVMTSFMPLPAFIAIGMEDSTIHIYNVRVDEVKLKLKGHQKRITGLAFSTSLNILVSSGADAQWVPQDALSAPISCAVYSCNSQLVFASFCDGNTGIFDSDTLRLRRRVGPSAYLPQSALNGSQSVYPVVVAAHPQEPNQFAVGLTDGSVKVIEPTESESKWGVSPPADLRPPTGFSIDSY